ncbi:uncharacterized protein ACRADG_010331 [Cochliomyia hominivorax]
MFKKYILLVLVLYNLPSNEADNCLDDAVVLDDQFVGCCRGRPKYTSEPCIDELFANDTFSPVCLLNCLYREYDIYNDSDIDLTAVQAFLDSQIPDADFNLMFMNAFERCSKLDKTSIKKTFNFIELKGNDYDCDEYPQYVDICVWYHTVANCPESYATNDETCNDKKEWVNECLLKS